MRICFFRCNSRECLDDHGALFVVRVGGAVGGRGVVYPLAEERLAVKKAALGEVGGGADVDVRRSQRT